MPVCWIYTVSTLRERWHWFPKSLTVNKDSAIRSYVIAVDRQLTVGHEMQLARWKVGRNTNEQLSVTVTLKYRGRILDESMTIRELLPRTFYNIEISGASEKQFLKAQKTHVRICLLIPSNGRNILRQFKHMFKCFYRQLLTTYECVSVNLIK